MLRMQVIEMAMAVPFTRPADLDAAARAEVRSLRAALVWACGQAGCTMADLQGLSMFEVDQLQLRYRMAMAAPPERCGPAMIAQPARGPMVASAPMGMIPEGESDWKAEHTGYRGRDFAREADAFDAMELQARRAAGGRNGSEALFSALQVATGRRYAMLVERHAASGMRCSSVEAQRGGGSGGGSFIDTVIYEGDLIRAMQRAIGDGAALAIRRIRPSQRGTRVGIRDRALVDAVCLQGKTVSEVLSAHGWSVFGETVCAARKALCGALDRMALAYAPPRDTKGLDA